MNSSNKKYYVEKKKNIFGFTKEIARPIREGVESMLNAYPEKQALVEMRNVDITYGHGNKKFKAISDISLNIYEGEVLGLVGESGSGKSTTGSSLVGLVGHSFGSIKIANRYLPQKNSKIKGEFSNFLVNKVQMIFQDPSNSLNPNKNIYKILSEGIDNIQRMDKDSIRKLYFYNFDQNIFKQTLSLIYDEKISLEKSKKEINDFSNQWLNDESQAIDSLYQKNKEKFSNNKELIDFLNNSYQNREEKIKLKKEELKRELIIEMLQSVGLSESVLKRYPLEFSGGQQQRIGISRAVVLRPKLLVADEPISALDVSIQAQVVNIFNDLKEKYNLTILFIAHDLRMVEYISDRIGVMNRGTLLEIGPKDSIMKNSLHPYTKSLLEAVPSIESKNESLIGYVYDHKMHNYDENNQPKWIEVYPKHFVLGTEQEIKNWKEGKY